MQSSTGPLYRATRACLFLCLSVLFLSGAYAQQPDIRAVNITRLLDKPLIGPGIHPSIGVNIQGPSMIRVPDWVENPLGSYYLYFADHKGLYIRLAYADNLTGPWQIHEPGSLRIEDSYFSATRPEISDADPAELVARRRANGAQISHTLELELTEPHIASPDVHVDGENQQIIMYYHGLEGPGQQHSRVATSKDGINFIAREENLGRTYMRAFEHDGMTYVLAMPGQFYRSVDGFSNFETGPRLFVPTMRHSAVIVRGDYLYVFWTRVGDAPESILLSTIDLRPDWSQWQESEEVEVLWPEFDWEGAVAPVEPSVRSTAYGQVNQLRDPALYVEDGIVYLLYAIAGESGIGLARVDF
ncbi:MAG: hypothetical protein QGG02_01180 [Gammaproteobacteria bacterium]|nr:hypothetical protein [Gammaproteobacteria bacterium]